MMNHCRPAVNGISFGPPTNGPPTRVDAPLPDERADPHGHVTKSNRWYAVIYDGVDPITGRPAQRRARRPRASAAPQGRTASLDRARTPAIPAQSGRPPPLLRPVGVGLDRDARHELLGLRWDDYDDEGDTISVNRGLVAVGYELQ